jgi:hypothetical protein
MAQEKWPTVGLHPDANEALKALIPALQGEGVLARVRRDDIASALALYTSPQQAAGMLAAFARHLAASEGTDQSEASSDDAGPDKESPASSK